jgi:hypothetical protein
MEKFLSIPVTSAGNQLVSVTNVILVDAASATATATAITYAGGKVVTLTHAAQVAFSMRDAIQTGIANALQTSWTNPVYEIAVPQAVSNIDVA